MADGEEKSILKSIFNPLSIAKFVGMAAVSYALFIPVDIYLDFARSALVHSVDAQPLVQAAYDNVGGMFSFLGYEGDRGLLSQTLNEHAAPYREAVTMDQGVLQNAVENNEFSADSVYSDDASMT